MIDENKCALNQAKKVIVSDQLSSSTRPLLFEMFEFASV